MLKFRAMLLAATLALPLSPAAHAQGVTNLFFDKDSNGADLVDGPNAIEDISPHVVAYSDVKRGNATAAVTCLRAGGSYISGPNVMIGATGTITDIKIKGGWVVDCDATKSIFLRFRDVVRPRFVGFYVIVTPNAVSTQAFKITVYRDPSRTPDALGASDVIYSRVVTVAPGNKQVWVSLADRGTTDSGIISALHIEQNNATPVEFGIDNLHFSQ